MATLSDTLALQPDPVVVAAAISACRPRAAISAGSACRAASERDGGDAAATTPRDEEISRTPASAFSPTRMRILLLLLAITLVYSHQTTMRCPGRRQPAGYHRHLATG